MVEKIKVSSNKRCQLIDITPEIKKIIEKEKLKNGIVHIYCPHTTAGITINENYDPTVKDDIVETLGKLIPYHSAYSHTEGNADAHIKASIVGSLVSVFVENGKLQLGTWQGIFFCEFDGPRTREVWLKFTKNG